MKLSRQTQKAKKTGQNGYDHDEDRREVDDTYNTPHINKIEG